MRRAPAACGPISLAVLLSLSLLAAPGAAPPAAAQTCPSTPALTSGATVHATATPSAYSVTPTVARWSAVGVRALDGLDWNIEARDAKALYPTCFTGLLASSAGPQVDFLVTDWHSRPLQVDYVGVGVGLGSGSDALVEYHQTTYDLSINFAFSQFTLDASKVLLVNEVQMQAGVTYRVRAYSASMGGLRLFVFAPIPAGGWAARSDRMAEAGLSPGSEGWVEVTAPVNGYYAIVVVNEWGAAGTVALGVTHCPFGSNALSDNAPFYVSGPDDWPAFTQNASSWAALGVRGVGSLAYKLDVAPSLRGATGYPDCTTNVLARATDGAGVRVLAGDFRSMAKGIYTVHAGLETAPWTSSGGYVEWEEGADSLVVNGPTLGVTPPANDVLDAWTVRLGAGIPYQFQLTPGAGTASRTLLLFANPAPGSAYWATRGGAVIYTATTASFTPAVDGQYGVVVVNDNGGTGGYSIAVSASLVDAPAPAGPPAVSRIRSLTPNPARGRLRVQFELARPGRVALQMRDIAGRIVAATAAWSRPAGTGELAWDAAVPTGVYFVVLTVDGRVAGQAKLAILR